jgi:hypothetical protein
LDGRKDGRTEGRTEVKQYTPLPLQGAGVLISTLILIESIIQLHREKSLKTFHTKSNQDKILERISKTSGKKSQYLLFTTELKEMCYNEKKINQN